MPHLRKRSIEQYLKKCLAHSPLVGVLGHRQVGKTTLISSFAGLYYTADDEESSLHLATAPEFIREVTGPSVVAIDEAQLLPDLFPALKEHVRKRSRPGQFILSGSVRFTSLKSITESLTGRILLIELLPLTVNELAEVETPQWLIENHQMEKWSSRSIDHPDVNWKKRVLPILEQYQLKGGLPGICFSRNDKIRTTKIKTQFKTLLDFDLRKVYSTKFTLNELLLILRGVAEQQGRPFSLSQLGLQGRRNSQSLIKTLEAMEALFMIRSISIEGDVSGKAYFFEDIAEYRHALGSEPETGLLNRLLIFQLVRAALEGNPETQYRMFQFYTRGGVEIPLAIEGQSCTTGFISIDDAKPSRREMSHARSFLLNYPKSKVLFLSESVKKIELIDDRMAIAPWWMLCW